MHNTAHNWQGTIWSWSKPWEAEYSSNCCIFHRLSTVVRADWGLISSEVRPCNILVFSAFSPEICVCSLHAHSAITPVSGTIVMSTLVPINDYCSKEKCSIFLCSAVCWQEMSLIKRCEHLCDTAVRLESFAGSEKETGTVYRDYHGLFHVNKLPAINTLTSHVPESFDLAFKLRRKKFVIEVRWCTSIF